MTTDDYERRQRRREELSGHDWELGPDAARSTPPDAIPLGPVSRHEAVPINAPFRVRFIHADADFEAADSDSHFDMEMWVVPREGEHIEFPQWFYQYGCVVTEVHWMLGDESPADVVLVVES